MSFSAGVYTLPTPALVPGQTVSSSENNTVRNDMAASFNLTWLRNGTAAATANIPMGGYKLTGLGAATTSGDALSYGNAAVVTTLTSTTLTATRVPYAGTGGLLQDASTFTFDGTTLTAGGFTTSGAISAGTISASGNITVSGGTANGVAYLNGSKVLTTGSALTFDGVALGIGTNSPVLTLDVKPAANVHLGIGQGQIDTTAVILNAYNDGAASNIPMEFKATNHKWLISNSEQMRLTSTGLGIGTSSPSYKLDVVGESRISVAGSNGSIYLRNTGSGGGSYRFIMPVTGDTLAGGFTLFDSTAGAYRLSVDSSGNLGLGVTPSAWGTSNSVKAIQLPAGSVWSYSTANVYLGSNNYFNGTDRIYSTSNSAGEYRIVGNTHAWMQAASGTAGTAISFTQAMTLDASGNLTINATSNAGWGGKLYVKQSGTTQWDGLNVIASANPNGVALGHSGTNAYLSVSYASGGSYTPLLFDVGGSERMRIDSSGIVNIATSGVSTYSARALNIAAATSTLGSANQSGNIFAYSTDAVAADIGGSIALGGYYSGTTAFPWCGIAGKKENATSGNTASYMQFLTTTNGGNPTERMRIDSSGNVGINTSSPSAKLHVSGNSYLIGEGYGVYGNADATNYSIKGSGGVGGMLDVTWYGGTRFITGGSERMRIDSSGNVGIGTSSPTSIAGGKCLTVYGNGTFATISVQAVEGGNDRNASLELLSSGNGGSYSQILFGDTDTTPLTPSPLVFAGYHSGTRTERMRIDSSGNLLVNSTSTIGSGKISVKGDSGATAIGVQVGANGNYGVQFQNASNVNAGFIQVNASTTTYSTSSDYRLKENIQPMQNALSVVQQLNPVTYNWKADGSDGQGFIAHELQAVVPDCVTGEKDAEDDEGNPVYQGIDTSFLVATLTKAIQELKAELDATKAEVAALKGA